MFNPDQQQYMKYLSTLPLDALCACRWNVKFDCYTCNGKLFTAAGGRIASYTDKTSYFLPDGAETTYAGAVAFLKGAADAARDPGGA